MTLKKPALRALVACLAGAGLLAATGASGAEPIGEQFRVSNQQPDGNAAFDALNSDIAHNTARNEYLMVWRGETATLNDSEIYGRFVEADGTPRGAAFQISTTGPVGSVIHLADRPAVAYNSSADEYYVVWHAADVNAVAGLSPNRELEIHGQRLSADGDQLGTDDLRISEMGPANDLLYDAIEPTIAYNSTSNEYLVAWSGNDSVPQSGGGFLVTDGKKEIWRQRISGDGEKTGGPEMIASVGDAGNEDFDAEQPSITYNPSANEYLVAFRGKAANPGSTEIYTQRLSGTGAEIGSNDFVISDVGPDDDSAYAGAEPAAAYNAPANEYLVAWEDNRAVQAPFGGQYAIHAQRLTAAGTPVGPDDFRVSDHVPGDHVYDARNPSVAVSPTTNEYMVAWHGVDDAGALVPGKSEIYAQRVTASGVQIGPDDRRISVTGPDDNAGYDATRPSIAYSEAVNEFMIAWTGMGDPPLVVGEQEIYAHRVKGAAAPGEPPPGTPPGGGIPGTAGAPSAANCVEVPAITGGGASGQLTLTAGQLKINQRIGQAAVRRANAIDGWLNEGLVNDDLCGGSLTGEDVHSGVDYSQGLLQAVPAKADPRNLAIPPATPKPGVTFEVTAEQLQINQKVYSAAVRRANALKARVEGKLTGGDIKDAQLTADRLRQDLALGALAPAASPTPASTTEVEPAQSKTATFEVTLGQLQTNQRIAQAAVKRTNELRTLLASGLKGENFADGSISAADFAP